MSENHCCNEMQNMIEEGKVQIGYNNKTREYYISLAGSKSSIQIIDYCPWCGSRLPGSLRGQWFETLEEEYNITDPLKDLKKLPPEFKTDEWWKKRGL